MLNSGLLLQKETKKRAEEKNVMQRLGFLSLERERESTFSLGFPAIGPLDFFGARRKVVLSGEGNAWAPVLGSFDKLHEVGVLSYLFYPLFKCFVMLVLV